jgi:flagellar biosynthetic protein FlhB
MAEQDGDKKHDPTPHKLEEARKKGQVAKSQDLAASLVLLIAIVLLFTIGKIIVDDLYQYAHKMLSEPQLFAPEDIESGGLKQSAVSLFSETVTLFLNYKKLNSLFYFFLLLMFIAVIANVAQIGFHWLPDKLGFDLTRLDPIKGFGRIFSMQSVVRLLMGIGKIIICAVVAWYAVEASFGEILDLSENETQQIASFLVWILLMIALKVAVALVIIALIDLMYQRWKHMQDLRMTDQEVRDEMKNMIGDPQIISKRRQLQREMATKQRTQGTSEADVVVTNPTHFAVAIKFDARTMDAPVVVAKGSDFFAFQIRNIAAEHGIRIVEQKELARALFARVEIGQRIYNNVTPEHVKMLGEVLHYVYAMAGRDFVGEIDYRQRTKRRAG